MLDIRRGENVKNNMQKSVNCGLVHTETLYILPVGANVWLMVGVVSVILAEDDGSG